MASSSAFLTGTLRCKDRESAPSPKSHFAFGSMPVSSSSVEDRKSTRLNSSHSQIPYAVSCLKKKNNIAAGHPRADPPRPTGHGEERAKPLPRQPGPPAHGRAPSAAH